jgi:hypothetical protein
MVTPNTETPKASGMMVQGGILRILNINKSKLLQGLRALCKLNGFPRNGCLQKRSESYGDKNNESRLSTYLIGDMI